MEDVPILPSLIVQHKIIQGSKIKSISNSLHLRGWTFERKSDN